MRRFSWALSTFILVLISAKAGLAKPSQNRNNVAKKFQSATISVGRQGLSKTEGSSEAKTSAFQTSSLSRFRTRSELFEYRLQKPQLKFNLQSASYSYIEPNFMSNKGLLYGLRGEFNYPFKAQPIVFLGQAEFMEGIITYDGAIVDLTDSRKPPTPVSNPTKDSLFELRTMGGYQMPFINYHRVITPYSGLGLRYLFDQNSNEYGYEREITYYYLPLGVRVSQILNHQWSIDGHVEYNHFLSGETKSYLTSDPIVHHQKEGRGYRLGFGGSYDRYQYLGIRFEVFYQSWNLGNSDVVKSRTSQGNEIFFIEPANQTEYFGISIGITI